MKFTVKPHGENFMVEVTGPMLVALMRVVGNSGGGVTVEVEPPNAGTGSPVLRAKVSGTGHVENPK